VRGYRKLAVAVIAILGSIGLCAFGKMGGGEAAGVIGAVAVAFLGANSLVHKKQETTGEL
jgi:hypothetical protein